MTAVSRSMMVATRGHHTPAHLPWSHLQVYVSGPALCKPGTPLSAPSLSEQEEKCTA